MDFGFVKNLVDKIVAQAGTRDVPMIAAKANIKIVYESWHPVTIGEFERNTKTIRVNRRASEIDQNEAIFENIVAHELGHFFAVDWHLSKADEERFAREFAKVLTGRE